MQRPPSETVKPELVVHAGIPKCATSSLQMLMIKQDFAVTRDLGLVWIGRGIRLWGPGVAVSEIMYDPGGTVDQIEALDLDPEARYFMSSEALSGTMEVFEALSRRFEISRVILSIRLPILTALSAYCYSGWLSQTPDEVAL